MVESGIAARFGRLVGIASVVGICVLAGGALPAQAATIGLYAAPTPAGAEDCSSPANACTLATAVTSANAATVGDSVQIKLARGVYLLSAPEPTALEVTFEGPVAFEAPNGTATISGTKTVRPLSVGSTSTVTIDGVDFEFGTTTGLGGAIENQGTLTVRNASFSSNVGANGGAISSAAGSTLTVEDSTFSHNSTTSVGGGALIVFGTATVVRSAITDNTAPVNGGGINVQPGGSLTFSNSTAAGNVSGSLGGAFSNLGTLSVQSSTIADNTATG
ncbi:MAG TPA: right-handed parallel beta-helix repeat-containing protein, partial [Solirubrobacterales bacterium]|nr:right-handed parallel beta-helix repeat-containing protein [Solirubrobacterales bacterium]